MIETTTTGITTIVVSIVGSAVGIVGVLGLMLRILMTSVNREFEAGAKRMDELRVELLGRIDGTNGRIDDTNRRIDEINGRIEETNRRIDNLTTEMHQRFDRVHQALGENRERMAKLEGALEGFLAGRRDRHAA